MAGSLALVGALANAAWSMDRVRKAIHLDELQVDLVNRLNSETFENNAPGYTRKNQTGDAKYWLYGIPHTGKGVIVANHEEFISNHLSFQEIDQSGNKKKRAFDELNYPWDVNIYGSYINNGHGTGTAGVIGGNGWGTDIGSVTNSDPILATVVNNSWNSSNFSLRGVAPGVIFKYMTDNYYNLGPNYSNSFTADVDNFSFTSPGGGTQIFSDYSFYSDQVLSSHYLNKVFVFAVGNNGVEHHNTNPDIGMFSIGYHAKNAIKVGATYPNMPKLKTHFSSMGPFYDGRIGIDVVAPGFDVVAPSSGHGDDENSYLYEAKTDQTLWTHTGTSFAAPVVTGIVALMLEEYRDNIWNSSQSSLQNRNGFWNSTVRGILVHTSEPIDDLTPNELIFEQQVNVFQNDRNTGAPLSMVPDFLRNGVPFNECLPVYTTGPDYATGYGLVNAKKSVEYVSLNHYTENKITENQYHTYTFQVTSSSLNKNQRVTLAWDDQASQPQGSEFGPMLTNDLDLKIIAPDGTEFYPWVLDGQCLYEKGVPRERPTTGLNTYLTPTKVRDCAATKNPKGDHVNNIEVVDFIPTLAGTYTIQVRGKRITVNQSAQGNYEQDYSLIFDTPVISNTPKSNVYSTATFNPTEANILNFTTTDTWTSSTGDALSYSVIDGQQSMIVPLKNYYIDLTHRGSISLPMQIGKGFATDGSDVSFATANVDLRLLNAYNAGTYGNYYGNVQLFINAPQAGIYSEYLGQVEFWCGGPYDCTKLKTYSFVIPLDMQKKLVQSGGAANLRFSLSNFNYPNNSMVMSNVHFDFQKIGAFTAQDCSNIPNRVAQTTQTFKEQLATLPARDISKPTTTYIFQCKPGPTSPWCYSSVYAPIYESKSNFGKTQLFPAAWTIIGECK